MLEVQGRSIIFYAHYTTSGVGQTGLTVTSTIYEVQRDGTTGGAPIVTDGACVEIGSGFYRYLLAAGSVDAAAEYIAAFHTATETVDQQDIPALWVIDRANLEDIDDILEDTGTTLPAEINAVDTDVMNATVEGTYTVQEVLRIIAGALAGKLSGGGTNMLTFRDLSDTLDRITATVNTVTGDRTAVTIDKS